MEIGIVGLPFSGKSTIFSTLLKQKDQESSGYHKQEAERGVVKVPDERLERLTEIFNPKKIAQTAIEYIKVPGFENTTEKPQGLPSQFIANVKTVDTIMLVIRAFESEMYPHPLGKVDPVRDIEFINTEFLLSDLAIVESRIEKLEKQIRKTKEEQHIKELEIQRRCHEQLEDSKPLRELTLTADDEKQIRGYQYLTMKPLLYVINIAEDQISNAESVENNLSQYKTKNCGITSLSAEIEKEVSELSDEDAKVFIDDLGITEPALNRLIRTSYELMGLISFFTVGEDECRSWTIRSDTKAQQAAGAIHSDLEKGFIRAETVHYDDLIEQGSLNACKDKGLLRLEGKEYLVKDGDILNIRFNV